MIFEIAQEPIDGRHPYAVIRNSHHVISNEVHEWCLETYAPGTYHVGLYLVYFSREGDRTWFLLRWG